MTEVKTEIKTESKKPEVGFMLKAVRLSFPDLFVAKQFDGKGPFNYSATFLIEPGSQNDKTIREELAKVSLARWADKTPAIMKTIEGQSMKFCYVDGNTKAYDGYENKWALSAKRGQDAGHPKVVDTDLRDLLPEEGRPYGGCFVDAKVSIWAQDNAWGKGMRCTLMGVQFIRHGDSFGGAPQATLDGFEAVEVFVDDAMDLI